MNNTDNIWTDLIGQAKPTQGATGRLLLGAHQPLNMAVKWASASGDLVAETATVHALFLQRQASGNQ